MFVAPGGADTGGRAQWYPGPCGKKGRWDTAPGERGGKDTGLESRMPGGGGAGSEDTEEGPGSQTPPLPRRLPLRCVWVRLRAGALQTSLLFPGEKPSLLVVSRS